MDTFRELDQFYRQYDEDARLTSQHGSVEFLTTLRYIEKYLQPGMHLLEIGAATGRYSHHFARQGYRVDAVELLEHNIEIFRKNTLPGEAVSVTCANAVDLGAFASNTYDITLLLGPMYHLFTRKDQLRALSEAVRVTRPGGILFVAYCGNEATMVQYCFAKGMLKQERYQKLVDPVTFKASSDPAELFALYRKEEIDELIRHFPLKRLHYVGSDMATNYMRQAVDEMDEELFAMYLRYHFYICERTDLVGASHHILDVLRKEDGDASDRI